MNSLNSSLTGGRRSTRAPSSAQTVPALAPAPTPPRPPPRPPRPAPPRPDRAPHQLHQILQRLLDLLLVRPRPDAQQGVADGIDLDAVQAVPAAPAGRQRLAGDRLAAPARG